MIALKYFRGSEKIIVAQLVSFPFKMADLIKNFTSSTEDNSHSFDHIFPSNMGDHSQTHDKEFSVYYGR